MQLGAPHPAPHWHGRRTSTLTTRESGGFAGFHQKRSPATTRKLARGSFASTLCSSIARTVEPLAATRHSLVENGTMLFTASSVTGPLGIPALMPPLLITTMYSPGAKLNLKKQRANPLPGLCTHTHTHTWPRER
jgi:hypothetical protein